MEYENSNWCSESSCRPRLEASAEADDENLPAWLGETENDSRSPFEQAEEESSAAEEAGDMLTLPSWLTGEGGDDGGPEMGQCGFRAAGAEARSPCSRRPPTAGPQAARDETYG